jgi:hypothetical protein
MRRQRPLSKNNSKKMEFPAKKRSSDAVALKRCKRNNHRLFCKRDDDSDDESPNLTF